jgi:hypothetical protein
MWRDYYNHHYVALFAMLYSLSRDQYGYSPWDSIWLAWYAAKAAKVFQPTHSRAEAEKALPILEKYYSVMRRHSRERFDPAKAARFELEWWQLRREKATSQQYGTVVAAVASELYGTHGMAITQSALLRAQMMQYRDERSTGPMKSEDWTYIADGLTRSYQLLKSAVSAQQGGRVSATQT